jgi:hypothetical protein
VQAVWSGWISSLPEVGAMKLRRRYAFGVVTTSRPSGSGGLASRAGKVGSVEVLDDLTGDHDIHRVEPKCRDVVGRLRVDRVGLEATFPGPPHTLLGEVEADDRLGHRGKPGLDPLALLELRLHATLVHEPDMNDVATGAEVEQHLDAVARPAAGETLTPTRDLSCVGVLTLRNSTWAGIPLRAPPVWAGQGSNLRPWD